MDIGILITLLSVWIATVSSYGINEAMVRFIISPSNNLHDFQNYMYISKYFYPGFINNKW